MFSNLKHWNSTKYESYKEKKNILWGFRVMDAILGLIHNEI